MSKDAYYFPHDCNAKDDPKCVLLIEQLGMEGYGIYWMLIETLREQPEYKYPVALLPALARRYNTTPEKVKTVVFNYGLFVVEEDNVFFSQSLINRMIPMEEKRLKLSEAGKRGNAKRWDTATRSPGDNKAIATQSQVNKSKVNKSNIGGAGGKRSAFSPPSLSEISDYIRNNSYSVDPQHFIDYYTSVGWKVGKNSMKDWKAAVRTWNRKNKSDNPGNSHDNVLPI